MNRASLDDHLRIINNNVAYSMNLPNDNFIEHRYEQRGAEYTLRSWHDKEMSVTASMVERPEWLVKIIDLAVIGGHAQKIPNPPPDLIVWFRTTTGGTTLLEFVDFSRVNDASTPYVRTT